ncbi:MAG TPA: tRNA uridine-5-carboxymethylaminomethyl(34) synthesis GTPase MnmE [Candidatus Didemnitutus sp.]|nr:tRNA uridine-5-carboxymethylaminomethyl(34) synthesis GTPase MnmE [Candidatus Didemnitutus sp.]
MSSAILSDTICALATPPGVAGLAVIRISGQSAFLAADEFFSGSVKLTSAVDHSINYGWWVVDGSRVDSVTAMVFCAPRSYTGENVVEIGCHGGSFVTDQIVGSLLKGGVRLAQPGEFTKRAFMNRKLDLTQAEAVADIIHAESRIGAQTAARQLSGGFTRRIAGLRQQLLDVIGLLELELDFSEEDVEFVDRKSLRSTLQSIIDDVDATAASAHSAEVLRSGLHVAVVGYPNAGKSSLFNALLGRERAIVSDIPGTTRDYLTETLFVDGYSVHLMDTAGLRETEDHIELQGIKLTTSVIEESDLIVVVNDLSVNIDHSMGLVRDIEAKFPNRPVVTVHNKVDVLGASLPPYPLNSVVCSAITGQGLDKLRLLLANHVKNTTSGVSDVLINARQAQLLRSIAGHLRSALSGLDTGLSSDLMAVDIRSSIRLLGDITGESWNPDVLDTVFSRFCIGK